MLGLPEKNRMKSNAFLKLTAASLLAFVAACDTSSSGSTDSTKAAAPAAAGSDMQRRLSEYTTYKLTADTTNLTPKERQMLPLLIDAAKAMDPRSRLRPRTATDSFAFADSRLACTRLPLDESDSARRGFLHSASSPDRRLKFV
jgi:hypothetical protein